MEKKFTRSQLFAVTVAVDDERLRALKRTPLLIQEAMGQAADLWHSEMLPEHFKRGARGKYGYAKRSKRHERKQRKRGQSDLVYTGAMRSELKSYRIVPLGKSSIRLKMHARVLNLVPLPQDSFVHRVTRADGSSYPNMKREIKVVLPEEREQLAEHVAYLLEDSYAGTKRRLRVRKKIAAAAVG